jgi:hypothetical protein
MLGELSIDGVIALYGRYAHDLQRVRSYQRAFYAQRGHGWLERHFKAFRQLRTHGIHLLERNRMAPALDDVEAEITYLLLREFTPRTVVEISPRGGWSTSWLLHALRDNQMGRLFSYDLVETSTQMIPAELSGSIWTFVKGDIRQNASRLPADIGYLFMDSDHSAEFAHWYAGNILEGLGDGIPVSVHDVYHGPGLASRHGEGGVILDWLREKRIPYMTAAPAKEKSAFDRIIAQKKRLNLEKPIHFAQANPMIFFLNKRR